MRRTVKAELIHQHAGLVVDTTEAVAGAQERVPDVPVHETHAIEVLEMEHQVDAGTWRVARGDSNCTESSHAGRSAVRATRPRAAVNMRSSSKALVSPRQGTRAGGCSWRTRSPMPSSSWYRCIGSPGT